MKPLQGIKVIELGTHVAVPMATRLLADWGADVIKIEGIQGDLWRWYGLNVGVPVSEEENPYFAVPNANKRIVSLDLKQPEGLELLHRLLSEADAFVTNVRMKGLARLGLDYDTLSQRYPGLVYFHFTGYGETGPWASRPGFDIAAFWGAGGMINNWPMEGDGPFAPSSAFGDSTVSSMAASGILAALLGRERSGEGCFLSTSLYATALWYNFGDLVACQPQYGCRRPYRRGINANPFLAPYPCGDGNWIYLAALEYERCYARCLRALGLEQYLDDERYNTLRAYLQHNREFASIIAQTLLTRPADEWVQRFEAEDIVIQRLYRSSELWQSEQAWAAGMFHAVDYPESGNRTVFPNTPVVFGDAVPAVTEAVGGIGCDTEAVLTDLGCTEEEIRALRERGVVRMPKKA